MNEEVYIPLMITQYLGLFMSLAYLFMILLGDHTFFRKSNRKKEKAFKWGSMFAFYVVILDLFTILFAVYSGKFISGMVIETIIWVAIYLIADRTMKNHREAYDHIYQLYEEKGRPANMLKLL
jgi:L-asparagine transporter-like permease